MATIRKRGKTWHVQIRQANKPSMTKSFARKADAVNWAQATEGLLRQNNPVNLRRDHQITLNEAIERYLQQVSPLKKGYKEEKYRLLRIKSELFSRNLLCDITGAQIASYRDKRLRLVSSAAVRRELNILRHLFNIAKKEWGVWISENPVSSISLPSCSTSRSRRVSDDEIMRLIEASNNKSATNLSNVIWFAIYTGMRKSEILAVRPMHIGQDNTLFIPKSKSGVSRTIPLHPRASQILAEEGGSFNFTSSGLRMAFERARKKASLQSIRFHDFRHEAISRFFEFGLSVPEVLRISGHSDVRMLMRYTHPKPQDIAKKLVQAPLKIALPSIQFSQEIHKSNYKKRSFNEHDPVNYLIDLKEQMIERFGFPPSLSIVQSAISAFRGGLSVEQYLIRFERVSNLKRLEQ